jgi:hypothetical protein
MNPRTRPHLRPALALATTLCLALAATACGGGEEQATPGAPDAAEAPTAAPAAGAEAEAAGEQHPRHGGQRAERPRRLLTQIYAQYEEGAQPAILVDDKARLERWFDDELTTLLLAELACRKRENGVCKLDWDPFVSAQDWKVEGLEMKRTGGDAQHATLQATFRNFGKQTVVDYSLVKLDRGWRIHDISYPPGGKDHPSLATLLAAK